MRSMITCILQIGDSQGTDVHISHLLYSFHYGTKLATVSLTISLNRLDFRAEICTGILNGAYGATPAANCISSTALATKLGSLCTAR